MTVDDCLRCIGLLLGVASLFGAVEPAFPAHGGKTLDRTVDPVTVDGQHFPNLLGSDIGHLRLFSFQHGRRIPIPFQIDQRDSHGDWVWDVAYTRGWPSTHVPFDEAWSPASEPVETLAGTQDDEDPRSEEILDHNDLLVFMARDLGDRNLEAEKALASISTVRGSANNHVARRSGG
jgi:hypothetical protein